MIAFALLLALSPISSPNPGQASDPQVIILSGARLMWPKVQQLVRLYYDEGVPLLAGSDTPNPWVVPGAGFHRELGGVIHQAEELR